MGSPRRVGRQGWGRLLGARCARRWLRQSLSCCFSRWLFTASPATFTSPGKAMEIRKHQRHVHPLWWTAALLVSAIAFVLVCTGFFAGTFRTYIPVTLTSDRSGLVMESGAKVKIRGVEVGRVGGIVGGKQPVSLQLEIFPEQVRYIPANVEAEIKATTAFGAKYVDLIYPNHPSRKRLAAGAVLQS